MPRVNHNTIAPEGTFINNYMKAQRGLETATAYDFWCACWVLSSVLGRSVYVDRPRIPVRLNWYLLLVAESGITRKSTAVVRARKLLASVRDDDTLLIEAKTTPEKLEYMMGMSSEKTSNATVYIAIPELVTFLGRERYTMQMPGLLTDLYDCPDVRLGGGVIGRREHTLRKVFVSFLSASTPSWLMRAINPDVIEGGFTSRTIFVVAERRKRRIAWPDPVEHDTDFSLLHTTLLRVRDEARSIGGIPLTPKAVGRFGRWYSRRVESHDPFRISFESREDEHVLRMAGLLAINEELYKVEVRHIEKATKIIMEVKNDAASLFVGGVRPDRLLLGIDHLRTVLLEAGHDGLSRNRLYHKVRTRLSSTELGTVLRIMHEHEMVQRFDHATSAVAKKKAVIWRATNKIMEKGRLDSVLANVAPDL